jgi:hypothetical protein
MRTTGRSQTLFVSCEDDIVTAARQRTDRGHRVCRGDLCGASICRLGPAAGDVASAR